MNITNTYDHRIIQGAESGLFLKSIDELLKGNSNFYINLFEDLNIPQRPVSWDIDSKTLTITLCFVDVQEEEEQDQQQQQQQLKEGVEKMEENVMMNF